MTYLLLEIDNNPFETIVGMFVKAITQDMILETPIKKIMEPGDESDNTTYQTVNIHSDISHIQWGTMQPQLLGDVRWSIKESNSEYTTATTLPSVAVKTPAMIPPMTIMINNKHGKA